VADFILDPNRLDVLGLISAKNSPIISPIPDDEYRQLVDRVFWTYESIISGLDDDEFDVGLSDFTFGIFIVQSLHVRAIADFCEKRRHKFVPGPLFQSLLRPDFHQLSQWYAQQVTRVNRFKAIARGVKYSKEYGAGGSLSAGLTAFSIKNSVLSVGPMQPLKREFLLLNEITRFQQCEPVAFSRPVHIDPKLKRRYQRRLIEPLLEAINDKGKIFSLNMNHPYVDVWGNRLVEAHSIYDNYLQRSKNPRSVLVTGGSNPIRKLFVTAMQRKGVPVSVFHHGNDVGARIVEHGHRAEASHVKNFVCPTRGIAENYRNSYSALKSEKRTGTTYVSLGSDFYRNLVQTLRTREELQKSNNSNNIMLIGRPLNGLRLLDSNGAFFLHKVDLELRLVRSLRKAGYELTYKAHPEWAGVARTLFHRLDCEVLDEPFEKIWEKGEIYLFSTATSSTFEFALSTARPVVLLNASGNKWRGLCRRDLEHRCEIIDYDTNARGGAIVEVEKIVEALNKAEAKKQDCTFLERWLF
jgi:hypothetical protein